MRVCPRCRSIYSAQIERCALDGERVVEEHTYPLIGEVVDRYRVVEVIGEGAMGCVYRATHTVLPREYALKVLFRDLATNQTLIERFKREAQAVSTIAHTNIVSVADFVAMPDGMTFIVMEMVHGRTLERAIAAEAPFTPSRAAHITRQIAAGLGEAHRMGFVHRDVKPSNIMLADNQGVELVKILDFGVVGLGATPMATRLTAIGHIIGTPTYMAPEQVHDPSVGPPADLYALGVILYEMLAGEPPFQGPGRTEVFIKHISEPPPPLPPAEGLELLASWLLEKKPERRPKSAEDVIQAIERLGIITAKNPASVQSSSGAITAVEPERHSGRPPIQTSSRSAFQYEDDTYELDTDSAIPRDRIRQALADTDPSGDQTKAVTEAESMNAADSGDRTLPPISVAAMAQSQSPSPADDHEPPPKKLTSADDLFPSLMPVTSSASGSEWSSWNPDGMFENPHPDPADKEHVDTIPVPTVPVEGSTTDPFGLSTSLAVTPEDMPAIDELARMATEKEARADDGPSSTQLVRNKARPRKSASASSGPTRPPDSQSDALDIPTDLMLFEPELPPSSADRTARNQVDDGPTQVDFSMNHDTRLVSMPVHDAPAPLVLVAESLPGLTPVVFLPHDASTQLELNGAQLKTVALTKDDLETDTLDFPRKPSESSPFDRDKTPILEAVDIPVIEPVIMKDVLAPSHVDTLNDDLSPLFAETMPDTQYRPPFTPNRIQIASAVVPSSLPPVSGAGAFDMRIAILVGLVFGCIILGVILYFM